MKVKKKILLSCEVTPVPFCLQVMLEDDGGVSIRERSVDFFSRFFFLVVSVLRLLILLFICLLVYLFTYLFICRLSIFISYLLRCVLFIYSLSICLFLLGQRSMTQRYMLIVIINLNMKIFFSLWRCSIYPIINNFPGTSSP